MKDLIKEIIKEALKNTRIEEIFEMIEDILKYLENDEQDEYETNQGIIGLHHLFRGYIVKVQTGSDFSSTRFKKLNKILIKYCIIYYVKCQKHRNEYYHDKNKQRERESRKIV